MLVETEPVVGEPLVGYRAWKVRRRRGLLSLESVYVPARWPFRKKMVAHCMTHGGPRRWHQEIPHVSPAPLYRRPDGAMVHPCHGQACGIYATNDEKLARLDGSFKSAVSHDLGGCFGPVRLWGMVVPYERGYRAQFAYPGEPLTYYPAEGVRDPDELASELAENYGIEVLVGER